MLDHFITKNSQKKELVDQSNSNSEGNDNNKTVINFAQASGWDIFCLDYHVDVPINTIFNVDVVREYSRIFQYLLYLKRVENSLTTIWKRDMKGVGNRQRLNENKLFFHLPQLLRAEMTHFVQTLQHYLMFEVLESNWSDLQSKINKAADLETIIESHSQFLRKLIQTSPLMSIEIQQQSHQIFHLILRFCKIQENLIQSVIIHQQQQQYQPVQQQQQQTTKMKTNKKGMLTSTPPMTASAQALLQSSRKQMTSLQTEFRALLKVFITTLASQKVESLRLLAEKLNANEFYFHAITISFD